MNKPLLSILIPTIVGREDLLQRLLSKICKPFNLEMHKTLADEWTWGFSMPMGKEIEVLYYLDDKKITIGEKREILYKGCHGKYAWQIDEDDDIADNAIELILQAIKENPGVDVISFKERCNMNGEMKTSNHSIKYDKWADNFDGYDYVRSIFYKDVIRTDIAKSVPFPRIRWNEDEQWSMALKSHINTEYHIDEELYYYIYEPKDTHEERYGLNK